MRLVTPKEMVSKTAQTRSNPLVTIHFFPPRLALAFAFLVGEATAGPGSSTARFAACFATVCPGYESARQVAKGHTNWVTKRCSHLRVRFDEFTASLEASNLFFASASRSLRDASASIAANGYDRLRQWERKNKYLPAHGYTP